MKNYVTPFIYGAMAGLVMIAVIMLLYFISFSSFAAGYLPRVAYIVLIFAMVWGGITIRRQFGGYTGIGQAILIVFIISVTATALFDTFGYVLIKYINPSIPVLMKAERIKAMEELKAHPGPWGNITDQDIDAMKQADFTPNIASLAGMYLQSVIIGAIFSALIGLFVTRPDNRPVKPGEQ